jgi:hypothetical protein
MINISFYSIVNNFEFEARSLTSGQHWKKKIFNGYDVILNINNSMSNTGCSCYLNEIGLESKTTEANKRRENRGNLDIF